MPVQMLESATVGLELWWWLPAPALSLCVCMRVCDASTHGVTPWSASNGSESTRAGYAQWQRQLRQAVAIGAVLLEPRSAY
jgi:hypothetical protein